MVTQARIRRKGPEFETLISKYLQVRWSRWIDRRPRAGAKDKGDIKNFHIGRNHDGPEVVIECKNEVNFKPSQWISEAHKEAENAGALAGIVTFKRPRKGRAEDQFVLMTWDDFLKILDAHAQ